jgi:hypothetical protein
VKKIYIEENPGFAPLSYILLSPKDFDQGGRAQHDFSLAWLEAYWYLS